MAHIERLQVEAEGFLSGLDVLFAPGLNVVIGARGTGKTSLLELIRFCLDAGALTARAGEAGDDQARAILEGGAVTVTLRDGDSRIAITRSADSDSEGGSHFSVTVLGQSEIEAVGAQSQGRLRLVDRYRPDRQEALAKVERHRQRVRSLTQEIGEILREIDLLEDQEATLQPSADEIESARARLAELASTAPLSTTQREQLEELQSAAHRLGSQEELLSGVKSQTTVARESITLAIQQLNRLPAQYLSESGEGGLKVAAQLRLFVQALEAANGQGLVLDVTLDEVVKENAGERARVDEESRGLRQALELVQQGIGLASRQVALLQQRVGQASAIREQADERRRTLALRVAERDDAFTELEGAREQIFRTRDEIAERLNERLAPNIRVKVRQANETDNYLASLVAAIRGSGLHYNTLAPALVKNVAPIEIVRWAETQDAASLSEALGLSLDRCASLIAALREKGVAEISAVEIEDSVDLFLLDGSEYKSTDRMSIGQRCTTVLPVLLGEGGDTLVLDQPEDHLDNAYIVSTLVTALRERTEGQFIFASHNANIPVLGGAAQVIVMGSDGERGFVVDHGPLESREMVTHITNLMEGGAKAFQDRADFYASRS